MRNPTSVPERTTHGQRKFWRIGAIAAAALLVILCALFAAPLLFDFTYFAPSAQNTEVVAEGMTATPPQGSTQQAITLTASGLEPGAEATILGGVDQAQMREISRVQANGEGNLEAAVEIPEWAERGKPFYFAAEANGERVGLASVNVIVQDDTAPAGAGGTSLAPQ